MAQQQSTEYCIFTFTYETAKHTMRYIPLNEVDHCYFIVCDDEKCPMLSTLHLHMKGTKGCSYGWKPCVDSNCPVNMRSPPVPHISHPKCIARRQNEPLPSFITEHTITVKPERVYHFRSRDFNDNRSKIARFREHKASRETNSPGKCKKVCRNMANYGKCDYNNCRFAHSYDDLDIDECSYGEKCQFVSRNAHDIYTNKRYRVCRYLHFNESIEQFLVRTGSQLLR